MSPEPRYLAGEEHNPRKYASHTILKGKNVYEKYNTPQRVIIYSKVPNNSTTRIIVPDSKNTPKLIIVPDIIKVPESKYQKANNSTGIK